MEFLSEAGSGALAPDEAELRAHYEAHPDRFTAKPRVSFRQVFLGDADPAPALEALAVGADPAELGRATLLPPAMEAAVATSVDGTFGRGFFETVSALEPGGWQGPVESSFGTHAVQLLDRQPATAPPFEAIREAVEQDWRRQAAEELREAQYWALRERYEIIVAPAAP
jgi:hypothetical protein